MVKRTKEEALITREQVLQAALRVFRRKGYAATTLEAIAQEAGFTRGAIYSHFEGKAQLYQLLIQQGFLRLNEAFEQAFEAGGTIEERLRHLLMGPLVFLEADGLARKQPGTQALIERILRLLDEGIAEAVLRADIDRPAEALALLATLNGAILFWFQSEKAFSLKSLAATLADTFLHSILSSG